MCRFIAYLGKPIMADELLLKPANSLVHQSYSAGEMPEILNGDGFGVGWYAHSIPNFRGFSVQLHRPGVIPICITMHA